MASQETFQEQVDKSRRAVIQHVNYVKQLSATELNKTGLAYFRAQDAGKPSAELAQISTIGVAAVRAVDWADAMIALINSMPPVPPAPVQMQSSDVLPITGLSNVPVTPVMRRTGPPLDVLKDYTSK